MPSDTPDCDNSLDLRIPVLFRFGGAGDAARNIAGVAAAGRLVREAAEAGFSEIWIVLPGEEEIEADARRDVERLAGTGLVSILSEAAAAARLSANPEAPALVVAASHLIPAETLRCFAASGEDVLVCDGQVLAWRAFAGTLARPSSSVRAFSCGPALPLDGKRTTRRILQQTGKPGDGVVSRWLNRPISRRISGLLLRVPAIRPIHATFGTAFLAALMFAMLIEEGRAGLVLGALLFQAASIFDGVDGEVARATFRTSRRGAAIDSAVDMATNLLFIAGLTIHAAVSGGSAIAYVGAWGFGALALGLLLIGWNAVAAGEPLNFDLLKRVHKSATPGSGAPAAMRFATAVASRDFFALLFAVMAIAGLAEASLYLFAIAVTIWLAVVLFSLRSARARLIAENRISR